MKSLKCTGCGAVSDDGFKPCGCATMVGRTEEIGTVFFLSRERRDAVARIICRYLTGKEIATAGVFDNWLCPIDDESANGMCRDIAEDIVRMEADQ